MSEGIVNLPNGKTVIINGGSALPGCPESPEQAKAWREAANDEKEEGEVPLWSWDCGYKLDFDGPIVSVSSRFYPPKSHYGPTWDGVVHIRVMGKEVVEISFDCPTLDGLRAEVESFIDSFTKSITDAIKAAGGSAASPAPGGATA